MRSASNQNFVFLVRPLLLVGARRPPPVPRHFPYFPPLEASLLRSPFSWQPLLHPPWSTASAPSSHQIIPTAHNMTPSSRTETPTNDTQLHQIPLHALAMSSSSSFDRQRNTWSPCSASGVDGGRGSAGTRLVASAWLLSLTYAVWACVSEGH